MKRSINLSLAIFFLLLSFAPPYLSSPPSQVVFCTALFPTRMDVPAYMPRIRATIASLATHVERNRNSTEPMRGDVGER